MTETAVTAPAKESWWEDLVDVFFSPVELYERRAGSSWFKPFLLLTAICFVLYYVFLPFNALVMEAAMLQNAPPGADVAELQQGLIVMKYLFGLGVPFMLLFIIVPTAVGIKIASALLEPSAKWRQAFMIATYATYVIILQQVLGALAVFIKSRSGSVSMTDVSFGALRIVDDADKVMQNVLGRFDLFAIWTAALTAIGLIVAVRMARGKAIAAAILGWLFVALPGLALAAMFGSN